jgi:ketosteroid isomerase-like protein
MGRAEVMRWVARYEAAWRAGNLDAVETLFTDDAHYRTSPYEKPMVGHAEIRDYWLDDEGKTFTMKAAAVAVEGRSAVVRVEVHYQEPDHEYRDLWVLRFADDGRVEDFEEWAYWPDKPFFAGDDEA